MKVNELIKYLLSLNIELSEIISLLKYVFNIDYNLIAINGDKVLDIKKVNKIIKLIKKGVPIAYISRYIDIRGLKIYVNRNVLIPRSETIEFICNYIYSKYNLNNSKVLDLCTGSGIISLLLKNKYKDIILDASDISYKALKVARINSRINNLDINYIHSNYFNKINNKYNYIISNPPYIPTKATNLEIKYEPKLALFAGDDGLKAYKKIFSIFDKYLLNNGKIFIELEADNYINIINLFKEYNPNYSVEIYKDLENRNRYLIGSKNE